MTKDTRGVIAARRTGRGRSLASAQRHAGYPAYAYTTKSTLDQNRAWISTTPPPGERWTARRPQGPATPHAVPRGPRGWRTGGAAASRDAPPAGGGGGRGGGGGGGGGGRGEPPRQRLGAGEPLAREAIAQFRDLMNRRRVHRTDAQAADPADLHETIASRRRRHDHRQAEEGRRDGGRTHAPHPLPCGAGVAAPRIRRVEPSAPVAECGDRCRGQRRHRKAGVVLRFAQPQERQPGGKPVQTRVDEGGHHRKLRPDARARHTSYARQPRGAFAKRGREVGRARDEDAAAAGSEMLAAAEAQDRDVSQRAQPTAVGCREAQ